MGRHERKIPVSCWFCGKFENLRFSEMLKAYVCKNPETCRE
jgi:hypothetical protein